MGEQHPESRASGQVASSSRVTVDIGVIEALLRRHSDVEIKSLELAPPQQARIVAQVTGPFFGQNMVVQPHAVISLRVVDGSVALQVLDVRVFGVPLPLPVIEQKLMEYTRTPAEEANQAIRRVVNLTGLALRGTYFTKDSLVLEFG